MKAGALDYVVKSEAVLADSPHIAERALREWEHVTELRRAEEALRHSEGRYQKIFDNSKDAIIVIDPELDSIIDANPRACSMLAYSRDELLSARISAVHPGEDMADLNAFAQSVFETGNGWTDELTCYTKDGRALATEISASSIQMAGWTRMIAMVRDITERRRAEDALRHSEAKSAAILESASEGVLVTDSEGRIVIANARTEALFGYSRDELVGHTVEMLVPKDLRGFHTVHRQRFFSNPNRRLMGANLGCLGRRKDGSQFPVDISLNTVSTEEGTLAIVFVVDLTERKQAEDALRRSEATNRAFVRAIPDVMYRMSRNGTLLDYNAPENEDLPHLVDWAIGETVSEALSPEVARPALQCIERALQTGEIQVLERRLLIQGEMRDQEVRFVANGPDEVLAIARDTTVRKQAEEEVRKLYRAVEHVSVAVALTDTQGRFEYVNPAFTRITGYTLEEVAGQKPSILKSGWTSPEGYRQLWETIGAGEEWRGEFHNKRKDGGLFWVSASISPIKNTDGIITHYIAVEEDITERKRDEDRLRASLDEKEVLVKEINHRVKNNLQIISSLLSLQSRDILDQRARQAFKVSQDRIKAMALVHEMLYQSEDLGRIDFGEYLQTLTTDLYNAFGLSAQGIDLKVDVDRIFFGVDTGIPCGLIVNELVSNALKHAFPGGASGEICVSVRGEDDRYTMVVKDNGVGLPEGMDFRQTTTLGLTIVNALAQQIKGAIDFSSVGGSEIKITFPAAMRPREVGNGVE
jgi:PAS domain S-box-containing protein